jgi:hypothetical protein
MSEGFNYGGNVGWTLWNLSKRISAVKYETREAQKSLETHTKLNDWPIEDLFDLRVLADQLQNCAKRADEIWRRLQEVVNESDSDLIDQHDGIAVIHGGGSRPELSERIRVIYGADNSDAESQNLSTRINNLKAKVEKDSASNSNKVPKTSFQGVIPLT